MFFALLDVSSIPHYLNENVTHPPPAIDLSDRSLICAFLYHHIIDKITISVVETAFSNKFWDSECESALAQTND